MADGPSTAGSAPSPSPSSALATSLCSLLDAGHLDGVASAQRRMLARYEKANETAGRCAAVCEAALRRGDGRHVAAATALVLDMKADLDSIFARIRAFKASIERQHPGIVAAAGERVRRARLARRPHCSKRQSCDDDGGGAQ